MDPIQTLIDSGASKNFIDITFARKHNIPLIELNKTRKVIGIQGKELSATIRFKANIEFTVLGRTFRQRFYAMPTGETNVVLGMTWLECANPSINWETKEIEWRTEVTKAASLEELPAELNEFCDVLSEEGFKELPPHREFACAINFAEGTELPKPARPFPLSPAQSKALDTYIEEELKAGKIRPSESPMACRGFFVPKCDEEGNMTLLRFVIDLRPVNNITIADQFPMPQQIDLLEKLKGAKIFTKLDLRMGFNNIRIKKGDEWKTALS